MTSVPLAGAIGVIVGVVIGAACALAAKRVRWNRRPQRMAVCPKCSGPADSCEPIAAIEETGDSDLLGDMICRRIVSELPFNECGFSFPRLLLDVQWFRVHGVGGTCSAGQTMWHAACYGRLTPFCSTEKIAVEILSSEGAEKLAHDWENLSQTNIVPAATQITNTPEPCLIQIRKAGRRRERLVVAVSDVAGEVARHCASGRQYEHLLDAECHLLFVDLQQEEASQLSVFHQFLVSLRSHRRLADSDRPIGPIAVCIPKCDMLTATRKCGSEAGRVDRFLKQIRDSGPSDERSTLSAIKGRHELVVKHADILTCVGSLRHRLKAECGPQGFMFFPMAAVGWPEAGADAWHLENRTISPWGVLDPLLWLIHASGFEALPS